MDKNITRIDVVHQSRNMMHTWFKIALPLLISKGGVAMTYLSDASRLLHDVHTSLCKPFLPEKYVIAIKLALLKAKVL